MNYTIMEQVPTEIIGGVMHYRVTLCCDTAGDIPEALDTWDAGSLALIVATHGYKMLNTQGEWV